ncbi:MAG: ferredoxin, partial [Ruminococcus sp.]|nr:ferredoxin [Candidatus Copronaster equi]
LNALLEIGFDKVVEVAQGAEIVTDATKKMIAEGKLKKPVISSACPAVCRLIRVSYPDLIDNILKLNTPMDETAHIARVQAKKETGLSDDEIGVFFITPCPAKITAIKAPLCFEKSEVTAAIAMNEIYPRILNKISKLEEIKPLSNVGRLGVGWATGNGEARATGCETFLAADGIENVIKILEEIENDELNDVDFVELNACTGGCVGGCLTVQNGFVAKSKIAQLKKKLPSVCNTLPDDKTPPELEWESELEAASVLKLADNVTDAMKLRKQVSEMVKNFPGLDCGTCGAPTCRALAEDIVRGYASVDHCIFRLKDEMINTKLEDEEIDKLIPVPFRGIDEEKLKWT